MTDSKHGAYLSSNGLVLFYVTSLTALFFPSNALVPVYVLALGLLFTFSAGQSGVLVLRRAVLSVVPLTVFLLLVWVGLLGHAPDRTLLYSPQISVSASMGVIAITSRLFLLALLTFAVVRTGSAIRPSFVRALSLPKTAKVILLTVDSVTDLMRQGAQRAYTALIVANILKPRVSLNNVRHGWLLVRTTWVAAIGMASERLDTKWNYEDLPNAAPIGRGLKPSLTRADIFWCSMAIASLIFTITMRGQ